MKSFKSLTKKKEEKKRCRLQQGSTDKPTELRLKFQITLLAPSVGNEATCYRVPRVLLLLLLYNCWSALEQKYCRLLQNHLTKGRTQTVLFPPKTRARCERVLVGFSPQLWVLLYFCYVSHTEIHNHPDEVELAALNIERETKPFTGPTLQPPVFESLPCWSCDHNVPRFSSFMLTPCDLCSQHLIVTEGREDRDSLGRQSLLSYIS